MNTKDEGTVIADDGQDAAIHDVTTRERGSSLTEFVRDHPLLVVSGGVAAGLIIGALFPRRTGKAIVKRSSALAELVSAAAASFGQDAARSASIASTQLREGSHVLADRAEDWTALALRGASVFAQSAAENLGKISEVAAERAEKFGEATADEVGKASHEALKRLDKAKPVVEAAATQAGKKVSTVLTELRARIIG